MRWWETRSRELMLKDRSGHLKFRRYRYRVLTPEGVMALTVIGGFVLGAGLTVAVYVW